jgi:2-phosphoglycerate kinase
VHPDALTILGEVGEALAADLTIDALLERILLAARDLTHADGATLYKVTQERLEFVSVHSKTLGLRGSTARTAFPPISLYDAEGRPNTATVASYCALYDTTVNVADVYCAHGFDFSGTRAFDRRSGYRTRSLLSVPIKESEGRVAAVLQLVNAIDPDDNSVGTFSDEHRRLAESLAGQAAAAWERHRLTLHNDVLAGSLRVSDAAGTWPLTKGQLARILETCGVPPNLSGALAVRVLCEVVKQRRAKISASRLMRLVTAQLAPDVGVSVLRRFRAWMAFKRSRLPLVVLIGGTSGTGKSTVAAQCSLHLDIHRTQSTDILREALRGLISADDAPELHRSSFQSAATGATDPALVRQGFLDQADWLSGAVDGVVQRSIKERSSTIVEGVHILPGTHRRYLDAPAVVVPVLLAVPQSESLKTRYTQRERGAPDRPGGSYLRHFGAIWDLQRFLVQRAKQHRVPVLVNARPERTLLQLLEVIADAVEKCFPPD